MDSFAALHPYLLRQIEAGQLSHAYIFTGVGRIEQAEALVAALECRSPQKNGMACGDCPACHNVAQRVHPDVRWLEPQGAQHKVEAMRALVGDAGLSRMTGAFKVYILIQAECISLEGANTLLKLLEEPVPGTVLILLCEQPDQLLPTIRSRCQQFSFGGKSEDAVLLQEQIEGAKLFLADLPRMPWYQVLLRARDFEKDRSGQSSFLLALLMQLHMQARGENDLPWTFSAALLGAEVVELAIEQLDRGINQKLLMDVTYLRLRQICV